MNTQINNSLSRLRIKRQTNQKPNFSNLNIKVFFNFKILCLPSLAVALFNHTLFKKFKTFKDFGFRIRTHILRTSVL